MKLWAHVPRHTTHLGQDRREDPGTLRVERVVAQRNLVEPRCADDVPERHLPVGRARTAAAGVFLSESAGAQVEDHGVRGCLFVSSFFLSVGGAGKRAYQRRVKFLLFAPGEDIIKVKPLSSRAKGGRWNTNR